MTKSNIKKYYSDLDRLIKEGEDLKSSLKMQILVAEAVRKRMKLSDEQNEMISKKKAFNSSYEGWYSEAVVIVKQILPDRLQDFKDHFEVPRNRKDITAASYRIQDALLGITVSQGGGRSEIIVDRSAAIPHFNQQLAILKAVDRRFHSSLFEIRQLVQADLFDGELDASRELLRNKYFRAAGVIAGVVLERHLRQVCDDHEVKITKKHPGISDFNELLKTAEIIDVPQWRHIALLGDYRNLCGHNKKSEPSPQQVTDLIEGTDKVLKTIA